MKADPEGIARTMKWTQPLEIGGEYDFAGISDVLSDLVPAHTLLHALKDTAQQLLGLKHRLVERGVPAQITDMSGSASILSPLNYNGGVYCEKGTLHRRYGEGHNRENSFSAEH